MSRPILRAVGRGAGAALLGGVLSAAVTRTLMRGVAVATNGTPSFSVAGTAGIAMIYVLALLPGAVALAASAGRWPWVPYGGGMAFLLFAALNIGGTSIADAHDMTAGRWLLMSLLVTAMAAVYAAHFVLVARWSRPRQAADRSRSDAPVPPSAARREPAA